MYMIHVPIGSTSTCAPSLWRKLNMLKLPSPSVVWAQNSPVILTIGFTRRRSISPSLKRSRHRRARESLLRRLVEPLAAALQGGQIVVAFELVDELADVLSGVREAAEVFAH